MDESNVEHEIIEPKHEITILNNKPDKQLLLWLNYPKIADSLNQQEQASDLDEKLDYLYEKIVYQDSSLVDRTELDKSLLQVERVLSLFISSQDHIEFQEEILKYLPTSRPELQQLILNHEIKIELEQSPKLARKPLQRTDLKEISFSEDSINELSNKSFEINHTSVDTETEEIRSRIRSDSSLIFNLASLRSFFNPTESLTDFVNQDFDKVKYLQPTLVDTQVNLNKVTQQIILNAPKVNQVEQQLEETWELVPKDELAYLRNLNLEDITIPIQEAYSQDDIVFWENLQEASEKSSISECKLERELCGQNRLKTSGTTGNSN